MSYNEDETVEQLKTWWQRYGTTVVMSIAIVLFAFAGWRYWNTSRLEVATAAQALQQQMLGAEQRLTTNPTDKGANTELQRLGHQLTEDYANTPYALDAALMLAKRAVDSNDLPDAVKQLNWVIDHKPAADTLALTQTRLARVLVAQKKYDDALALLKSIKGDGMTSLIAEIQGDIYVLKGDRAQAASAYRAADADLASRDETRPVLELKLADAGLSPAPRKSDNVGIQP